MSALTPASEVMLRHSDEFESRHVLFAGDLQDTLAAQFECASLHVHCNQYHHWQSINASLGEHAQFGLLADVDAMKACDTLVYFWPKSKQEAQFQLTHLLAHIAIGSEIFVVGENRSGVRSAEGMIEPFATLQKIDSARRCGLYHGRIDKNSRFDLNDWWDSYQSSDITVKTLPGVFSKDALDNGSQLLIDSYDDIDELKGRMLDVGCGAGVLASTLAVKHPKLKLTLSDVSIAAIEASKATLAANNLEGDVVASNVYSAINTKFDIIISNPPFHDGMQTSLHAAEMLIRGAAGHLHIGGKLRIVANAFLPYPALLDATFGEHRVLAQTGKFKVYEAVLSRPPRPALQAKRKR